jgi:hypothetical protein
VKKIDASRRPQLEGKINKKVDLEDLLHSVIDETIKYVFKKAGAEVIYDYIEVHFDLKIEEAAEKPEVFSAGLKALLCSGAPIIEEMILENLYYKLRLNFARKSSYEFSDYIRELKETCSYQNEEIQCSIKRMSPKGTKNE